MYPVNAAYYVAFDLTLANLSAEQPYPQLPVIKNPDLDKFVKIFNTSKNNAHHTGVQMKKALDTFQQVEQQIDAETPYEYLENLHPIATSNGALALGGILLMAWQVAMTAIVVFLCFKWCKDRRNLIPPIVATARVAEAMPLKHKYRESYKNILPVSTITPPTVMPAIDVHIVMNPFFMALFGVFFLLICLKVCGSLDKLQFKLPLYWQKLIHYLQGRYARAVSALVIIYYSPDATFIYELYRMPYHADDVTVRTLPILETYDHTPQCCQTGLVFEWSCDAVLQTVNITDTVKLPKQGTLTSADHFMYRKMIKDPRGPPVLYFGILNGVTNHMRYLEVVKRRSPQVPTCPSPMAIPNVPE
jgi:hypothetical protein